ncbi:DUF2157 domain-containing protein [Novosphingobium sp. 1949]|uniref:DUF2157 domain-containing protein n=1 Tax=Novosphingobium organovorum TaxID=2930092 RepID=A0ABT0BI71_9SPHN|nr:DUF2157 domain-containing protein [Novosphingobium organovorum]MCJ2184548.1 DUF2157 domain-containing protein [Novosphingobium organovorum]
MNWHSFASAIFPYIEPLTPAQKIDEAQRLRRDRAAIRAAVWNSNEERALDEAQKVAAAEMERVRTAEGKATTYLAVLAALVPVIITLQAANWEKKAGPAPDAARLFVLTLATVYVAGAGFNAFKTLQVRGFQKVGESEIAAAWRTPNPLRKLTRGTLLATRNSRDVVNEKVSRILVTHEHLLRAFGIFILLLLLDPLFYAMGFRNVAQEPPSPKVIVIQKSATGFPSKLKCTITLPEGASSRQITRTVISEARPRRPVKPRTDRRRAAPSSTQLCPQSAPTGTTPALQIAPASQDGAIGP